MEAVAHAPGILFQIGIPVTLRLVVKMHLKKQGPTIRSRLKGIRIRQSCGREVTRILTSAFWSSSMREAHHARALLQGKPAAGKASVDVPGHE